MNNKFQAVLCEESLISCLLSFPGEVEMLEGIVADDFSIDIFRDIFSFILLHHKNYVDLVTMGEAIVKSDLIKKIGGEKKFYEIASAQGTVKNIEIYKSQVVDFSRKRKLFSSLKNTIKEIEESEDSESFDVISEIAEKAIFSISNEEKTQMLSLKERTSSIVDRIDSAKKKKDIYPTGFHNLDHFIKGFKPSNLIYIAARPSVGKTTFAVNVAANISKTMPILFFSLEVSQAEIENKILSHLTGIHYDKIDSGLLNEKESKSLFNVFENNVTDNFFVESKTKMTTQNIRRELRKFVLKNKKRPVVFVDYLQLIKPIDSRKDRYLQVDSISKELKEIAKEFNVPIVVLCQLNRDIEKRASKVPLLSDMRESGSLEQDADMVLFIYKSDEESQYVDFSIAKNRNGMRGGFRMVLDGEKSTFIEQIGF